MVEYKKFSCPHGDDFEGGEVCDRCDYYEICMEMPTVDVVEWSEYDKLSKENMRIDDALHAANQEALKYIEKCRKLRFRVNKAIEEIKEVSFKHHFELGEYIGEETETWEVVKLDHVIDILKRNMEEQ